MSNVFPLPLELPSLASFDASRYCDALTPALGENYKIGVPIAIHSRFTRSTLTNSELRSLKFEKMAVGGADIFLMGELFPQSVWNSIPMLGHAPIDISLASRNLLQHALSHLSQNHNSEFVVFSKLVTSICWTKIYPEADAQTEIATASFPTLPFCIFASDRGAAFLPPLSGTRIPSARILADNLLHEAIHQSVNMAILSGHVLPQEYRSDSSPRVSIPWRQDSIDPAHRQWELDRVFHAATVYAGLIGYRARELASKTLTRPETEAFVHSGKGARSSLDLLLDAIHSNAMHFSGEGRLLIAALQKCATSNYRDFDASLTRYSNA